MKPIDGKVTEQEIPGVLGDLGMNFTRVLEAELEVYPPSGGFIKRHANGLASPFFTICSERFELRGRVPPNWLRDRAALAGVQIMDQLKRTIRNLKLPAHTEVLVLHAPSVSVQRKKRRIQLEARMEVALADQRLEAR